MITDFILDWFNSIVLGFIELLPESGPGVNIDFGWIGAMNFFLPIGEMFGLFVIFFALGGPFVGSSLIIWWVVGVLRGGATKA